MNSEAANGEVGWFSGFSNFCLRFLLVFFVSFVVQDFLVAKASTFHNSPWRVFRGFVFSVLCRDRDYLFSIFLHSPFFFLKWTA